VPAAAKCRFFAKDLFYAHHIAHVRVERLKAGRAHLQSDITFDGSGKLVRRTSTWRVAGDKVVLCNAKEQV